MESEGAGEDITERVVPTENVQLMFHYKDPFTALLGENKPVIQPRSIISGLSDGYSDVSTHGETGVIFIAFRPAGACYFLGFSLAEIENRDFDMADLFGNEIKRIDELLFLSDTTGQKAKIIDDFLISRFSPIPAYDGLLINKGIEIIQTLGGQINAAALAERLATTSKSLERKFSEYVGKTPKQYGKLVRFQRILAAFGEDKRLDLTECAYRNGYFDQSHFIRDFRSYTGYAPGEFLEQYPCPDAGPAYS